MVLVSLNNVCVGVAAIFRGTNVVEHMSVIWRDTIQLQKRNSTNLQFLCDTNRNVFHKAGVNLKYYYSLVCTSPGFCC